MTTIQKVLRSDPAQKTPARSAAILAGGKSQRFGSNKALAPWFSCRLIDAVVQAAKKVCQKVIIIAKDPRPYSYLGLPIYPDIVFGKGPMAGLQSALYHTETERVLLLGCDMPILSTELLNQMWKIPTWAPIIIPGTPHGLEPLHAIYHKSLLYLVNYQISAGRLSLQSFIRKLPHFTVDIQKRYPFTEYFSGANTPKELAELKKFALRNTKFCPKSLLIKR